MSNNPLDKLNQIAARFVKDCVRIAKIEYVNYSKSRFRKTGQAWDGKPWAARKDPKTAGRALLVEEATLERSIRGAASGLLITISSDVAYADTHNQGSQAEFVQNVKEHKRRLFRMEKIKKTNKKTGAERILKKKNRKEIKGDGIVKAHTRKMKHNLPKRQFIGESTEANANIKKIIELHFEKTFNNK